MKFDFIIPGRLPNLNDIIASAQRHRFAYGSLKKKTDAIIGQVILAARVPIFTNPVHVEFEWVEPNFRRDPDDITAGAKFILDSLVSTGRIPNDGWAWIKSIQHTFSQPDKRHPHIRVFLREATPE